MHTEFFRERERERERERVGGEERRQAVDPEAIRNLRLTLKTMS